MSIQIQSHLTRTSFLHRLLEREPVSLEVSYSRFILLADSDPNWISTYRKNNGPAKISILPGGSGEMAP